MASSEGSGGLAAGVTAETVMQKHVAEQLKVVRVLLIYNLNFSINLILGTFEYAELKNANIFGGNWVR